MPNQNLKDGGYFLFFLWERNDGVILNSKKSYTQLHTSHSFLFLDKMFGDVTDSLRLTGSSADERNI